MGQKPDCTNLKLTWLLLRILGIDISEPLMFLHGLFNKFFFLAEFYKNIKRRVVFMCCSRWFDPLDGGKNP